MVYRLSRRAEADLVGIGEYTLRTWGGQQASDYLNALEWACKELLASPQSIACDELYPGMRRLQAPGSRHILFFLVEGGEAFVVRILHERMDFADHLPDPWDD